MLKNKRILLVILGTLLLIILPTIVNGATIDATETTKTSTGIEIKWKYELENEAIKNLVCANINSVTGELVIPSKIDGYNVTSLGEKAFRDCAGLRKVTIPDSVTNIGSSAFSGCTGMTSIIIPDSVTNIGSSAFSRCTGLIEVKLSKNITKLSNSIFEDCYRITEIVLPDNLTTIGDINLSIYDPFEGCTGLKYIKIPESVVSIAEEVFYECDNLTIYAKEGSKAQQYAENNNIKFEKIENWDKRNQNTGSDVTSPAVSKMYLEYSDMIGRYDSTTKDYRVPVGSEITIVVEFNENISGTQTPILTIKCGTGENKELKNGTISGKKIVYTYKINQGDEGLITAVKLEGGNVTDNSGNAAKLSVKELKVDLANEYAYAVKEANNNNNQNSGNKNEEQNNANSEDKKTDTKKDTTVATTKLPNTGKVILIWSIAIVTVSAIVAHIRYKKLYIK